MDYLHVPMRLLETEPPDIRVSARRGEGGFMNLEFGSGEGGLAVEGG